jgi:predicted AAA+ superfamily ATPase
VIGVDRLTGWVRRRRAARRRFNPYIAGTPVFDRQLFVGRRELALRTLGWLPSRSVKLTGERRIGKTSFLHHLERVLSAASAGGQRWFPVYVDLEAVTAPPPFHALMEEAVEALEPSPSTRAALRFDAAHNGYHAVDFRHDVSRLLDELRSRSAREVRLVMLIDEVDALRDGSEGQADHWLGALLEGGPAELRVVLAGVTGSGRTDATRPGHATLAELELGPLTAQEAEELITMPVDGVYRYEPSAVERILQRSRLRPYEIQGLCLHAVNRMLDDRRTTVRLADVERAGSTS